MFDSMRCAQTRSIANLKIEQKNINGKTDHQEPPPKKPNKQNKTPRYILNVTRNQKA